MSEAYRVVSALPPGTALSRFIMCLGASHGDVAAAQLIAERWKDSPPLRRHSTGAPRRQSPRAPRPTRPGRHRSRRTASRPKRWRSMRGQRIILRAQPEDAARALSHQSAARDGQRHRRRVGRRKLQHAGREHGLRHACREPYKAQKIVPLSRELMKFFDPDAERTVRDTTMARRGAFLDGAIPDEHVTLVAQTRPAADHEWCDGRHEHRQHGSANQCGPGRDARGDHDVGH